MEHHFINICIEFILLSFFISWQLFVKEMNGLAKKNECNFLYTWFNINQCLTRKVLIFSVPRGFNFFFFSLPLCSSRNTEILRITRNASVYSWALMAQHVTPFLLWPCSEMSERNSRGRKQAIGDQFYLLHCWGCMEGITQISLKGLLTLPELRLSPQTN